VYGWHYGFGIAAIFMLVGLTTYLYGYRYLPARVERRSYEGSRLSAAERRHVGALIVVMMVTILTSTALFQVYNVLPIWVQQYVALDVGGFRMPIPWYQSLNALGSILGVPLLFWLWRRQAMRGREPDSLTKMGIGAWLTAASNLILAGASFGFTGAPLHPLWPLLYVLGLGISFLYYWPTLLATVSRAAPTKVNATLMGLVFMSLFISNTLGGWIGSFYERMRPVDFWALQAAIAAAGGLLIVVFGRRLSRALQPG
jgi:POT family proton-dependent oligopeptide transporter